MPKTKSKKTAQKSTQKKTARTIEFIPEDNDAGLTEVKNSTSTQDSKPKRTLLVGGILIIIILIAILVKNGQIIAATVNGKPIFRQQVTDTLYKRYGEQTLELIITERLIEDAANNAGVSISEEEIDKRVNEMVSRIGGGVSLDDLLKYQGVTKKDFENQLKLQLAVEKILSKDINVTEGDIDNYIATSSSTMVATDEASMREEARKAIIEQTVGQKIQPWFNEIKEKANVVKFIK